MQQHPALGAEALLQSREASPLAISAAFGHHVRFDRKGYPEVKPWFRPSRLTGLLQICDVFDALTSQRPYKPALTPRRAYEVMLKDPGAYDPAAFRAFIRAVGFYKPGSMVMLDSHEVAFVLCAGAHPAKPIVEVRRDACGNPVPMEERRMLDLGGAGVTVAVEDVVLGDLGLDDHPPHKTVHGCCPTQS
jgi:hypothetical protein